MSDLPNSLPLCELSKATMLVHECCELGRDPSIWQLHLLSGLRRILEAPVASFHKASGLGRPGFDGRPTIVTALLQGFDEVQRRKFEEYTKLVLQPHLILGLGLWLASHR